MGVGLVDCAKRVGTAMVGVGSLMWNLRHDWSVDWTRDLCRAYIMRFFHVIGSRNINSFCAEVKIHDVFNHRDRAGTSLPLIYFFNSPTVFAPWHCHHHHELFTACASTHMSPSHCHRHSIPTQPPTPTPPLSSCFFSFSSPPSPLHKSVHQLWRRPYFRTRHHRALGGKTLRSTSPSRPIPWRSQAPGCP